MEQVVFINNRGQKVTVIVEGGEPTRKDELAMGARYLAECLGSHLKDGYGCMGTAIPFATDDDSKPAIKTPRSALQKMVKSNVEKE